MYNQNSPKRNTFIDYIESTKNIYI